MGDESLAEVVQAEMAAYFEHLAARIERLVRSLRVGGYLVVGTSERVSNARELGLVSPFPFIYRKTA